MREKIKLVIIEELLAEVTKKYDELLKKAKKELELSYELAIKDPLTSLYNELYLKDHLIAYIEKALRNEEDLCVAFIDLDNFKYVNDNFGHQRGDGVLKGVADILKREFRVYDLVARKGGDEFVVVTLTNKDYLEEKLLKIRALVEDTFNKYGVSMSFGIACLKKDIKNFNETYKKIGNKLLNIADKRMYENKKLRKAHR